MNEIILAIITLVTTSVTAGLVQWYYSRKAHKRQTEAAALKAEAEAKQSEAIAQQAARQAAIDTESKVIANYERQIERMNEQLDRMNKQIEFKDSRIEDLNQENGEKELRFIAQTDRLRECQDREYKTQQENNELRRENEELKLDRERHKCIKELCPYKEPATEKTLKARREQGVAPKKEEMPLIDPAPELSN